MVLLMLLFHSWVTYARLCSSYFVTNYEYWKKFCVDRVFTVCCIVSGWLSFADALTCPLHCAVSLLPFKVSIAIRKCRIPRTALAHQQRQWCPLIAAGSVVDNLVKNIPLQNTPNIAACLNWSVPAFEHCRCVLSARWPPTLVLLNQQIAITRPFIGRFWNWYGGPKTLPNLKYRDKTLIVAFRISCNRWWSNLINLGLDIQFKMAKS